MTTYSRTLFLFLLASVLTACAPPLGEPFVTVEGDLDPAARFHMVAGLGVGLGLLDSPDDGEVMCVPSGLYYDCGLYLRGAGPEGREALVVVRMREGRTE